MVAILTSIDRGGKSLFIQGACPSCRACPARARWGQNNRSVTQSAEYFHGGAQATGTFSEVH